MLSSPRLHVTFVCSFNRARSVMAAALFAEQLQERGLGDVVQVSSAGTLACVGDSALGGIVELGLLDTDGGPEGVGFGQELAERYDVEVLDISDCGQLGDFAPGFGE